LRAGGGTAIQAGLDSALELRGNDDGRSFTMVFFTDGQPTWGERNPQKIMENVKKRNTGNTRIFSFGVGDDVNTVLLDGLADTTKAVSSYVREAEDIEAKVSSLYAKISNPVLANLKLELGGDVVISEMYPQQLPDLFHGTQLVIFGRYTGKGHAGIKLTGQVGKETRTFDYELKFDDKTAEGKAFVEDLWARRKVGHLLDQIRVQGEDKNKEVVDEIIQLAKRYGITTPYTSYLLVPDAPPPVVGAGPKGTKGKKGGPVSGVPQALLPGGIGGGGGNDPKKTPTSVADFAKGLAKDDVAKSRVQLESDRLKDEAKHGDAKDKAAAVDGINTQKSLEAAKRAFNTRDLNTVQQGTIGVDFAVQNNNLRFQNQMSRTASRNIQSRNVVEVGGVWIDDGFNPKMDTVTVKAQSKAYFDILAAHPEMKDVYALGNYIIWVTPSGKALIVDRNAGADTLPAADIAVLFKAPTKAEKK
jgi:Ca-activated chloride channel family protein